MIYVYKAQQTLTDKPVNDLHLVAVKPIPEVDDLAEAALAHASLPGGTVDAVLRLLLESRALLRVRWPR